MARVALIAAVTLAFFFIQLASSQNTPSAACQDAARAFTDNFQQCTPTTDNPFLICDPPCRGYYEDFINECSDVPVSIAIYIAILYIAIAMQQNFV